MKTEENEKLEEWLKWRRGYLSLFYGERMRPQCFRNVEEGRPQPNLATC